jgi:hypothetical protein
MVAGMSVLSVVGGFVHYRRISTAILALASVAFVAACDDDDDPIGTGDDNTTVRFFNATSGGLNLDIAENGTVGTGNSNIEFGRSSSCTRVSSSNPQIAVRPANSTTSLPGFTPSLAANGTFTVLVTGTQASPVFTTLNDEFTTPTTGNAAVRIVNATTAATTGAGNWDVYVNPATPLGTPNETTLGRTEQSAYLTVPAGQQNTIRLTNTGQTTALQTLTVPSLSAGTVSTIVVTDAAAGSSTLQTFTIPACT